MAAMISETVFEKAFMPSPRSRSCRLSLFQGQFGFAVTLLPIEEVAIEVVRINAVGIQLQGLLEQLLRLLEQALQLNPNGIDPNYFYGRWDSTAGLA